MKPVKKRKKKKGRAVVPELKCISWE